MPHRYHRGGSLMHSSTYNGTGPTIGVIVMPVRQHARRPAEVLSATQDLSSLLQRGDGPDRCAQLRHSSPFGNVWREPSSPGDDEPPHVRTFSATDSRRIFGAGLVCRSEGNDHGSVQRGLLRRERRASSKEQGIADVLIAAGFHVAHESRAGGCSMGQENDVRRRISDRAIIPTGAIGSLYHEAERRSGVLGDVRPVWSSMNLPVRLFPGTVSAP